MVPMIPMRALLAFCLALSCYAPASAQTAPASAASPASPAAASAPDAQPLPPGMERVAPAAGFQYPYYLIVPPALREATGKTHTMLVLPNNTGRINDHLDFHEADVKRRFGRIAATGANIGTQAAPLQLIMLMPVFPRPELDWHIYTHALDRDAMLTEKAQYRRFDLQLLAMIDHARALLAARGLVIDEKVFLHGFSASGMFANRFTLLHPQRVKAAAIGSPGGWPIAPVATVEGRALRYPLGVADIAAVAGKPLDLAALRKVPLFFYLGDKDDNDSLTFTDGYDPEDKELGFAVLGTTPVARWPLAERLYREAGLQARFKLYPGAAHSVTAEMREDIAAFFRPLL